jgi:hypothetical protein
MGGRVARAIVRARGGARGGREGGVDRITSLARTLLDLAATVRPDRLERALVQAEREPKLTRSELEAIFLRLVRQAGLPEPQSNLPLAALDHPRLEPDFYWPTHRLVVETDGWETHGTRAAFQTDRRRDAALVAAGWRVMRFTYDDVVREGSTVVRRLRAAGARAA